MQGKNIKFWFLVLLQFLFWWKGENVTNNTNNSNNRCTPFILFLNAACAVNCKWAINPLNAELNPICQLLALLGAHPFLHVSRTRVDVLYKNTTIQFFCIPETSVSLILSFHGCVWNDAQWICKLNLCICKFTPVSSVLHCTVKLNGKGKSFQGSLITMQVGTKAIVDVGR